MLSINLMNDEEFIPIIRHQWPVTCLIGGNSWINFGFQIWCSTYLLHELSTWSSYNHWFCSMINVFALFHFHSFATIHKFCSYLLCLTTFEVFSFRRSCETSNPCDHLSHILRIYLKTLLKNWSSGNRPGSQSQAIFSRVNLWEMLLTNTSIFRASFIHPFL